MVRTRHIVVALALAAFASPYVGQLADALLNDHVFCPEHGDFVHDGETHSKELALNTHKKDTTKKAHSHCESWKAGLRPLEQFEKCPEHKPAKQGDVRPNEPRKVPDAQLPVYALAPKTSPPAHV